MLIVFELERDLTDGAREDGALRTALKLRLEKERLSRSLRDKEGMRWLKRDFRADAGETSWVALIFLGLDGQSLSLRNPSERS